MSESTSTLGLFDGLDMSTIQGKRAASERLINAAKEKGINIPNSEQEAKVRFGSIIVNNVGKSPDELLLLAEQMFGTAAAMAVKSEGSKAGTVCPENSGY